jgi:hypothetical protein
MDGSNLVFFEVGTRNKSPITELTIIRLALLGGAMSAYSRKRKRWRQIKGKMLQRKKVRKKPTRTNEE